MTCPATTINKCILRKKRFGIYSGLICTSGYKGSCLYYCNKNGNWRKEYNNCRDIHTPLRCQGKTINNCVVPSTYFLGGMGACAPGYYGWCKYFCDRNGNWRKYMNGCRPDGDDFPNIRFLCPEATINNCTLDAASDGAYRGECAFGYTGSCFYYCNKHGNWIKDTNTCRAQAGRCLGKTINNCVVPSTYFLGGMGVCAPGYTGSCAYHCGIKGDWIKDHNSCHVHVE